MKQFSLTSAIRYPLSAIRYPLKYFCYLLILFFSHNNAFGQPPVCDFKFPISSPGQGPNVACDLGTIDGPLITGECDSTHSGEFIVRVYVHLLTRMNGTGAQSLETVNESLNIMVRLYAEHGITFSFEELEYLPVSDLYYYYDGSYYNEVVAINSHIGGIDLYFCGPGIYNNGRAQPTIGLGSEIKRTSAVIGGGVDAFCGSPPLLPSALVAHEVGHLFGLLHPDEQGLADTPPMANDSLCYENPNDCRCQDHVSDTYGVDYKDGTVISCLNSNCDCEDICGTGLELVENIMATNTTLSCRSTFTDGQVNRMKRYLIRCSTLQYIVDTTGGPIKIATGFDIVFDAPNIDCLPSIEIQNGAKLTIQTDLNFDVGEGITIKAGGRLDVQGATLSGCGGAPWRGIDVEGSGNNQVPPAANGQGHLEMDAGAELLNAEFPIRADRGALVRATDSGFTDCGPVSFKDYRKFSFSIFKNCNFTRSGSYAFAHDNQFRLENMGNMYLAGCNFQTLVPSNSHRALEAIDSKFTMDGGTRVEGFRTGVMAYAWFGGSNGNFSIKGCNFKDNQIGVAAWGNNNPIIQNTTFEGIGQFPGGSYHYGLALRHSPAFTVTGNTLKGVQATSNTTGILMSNTGGGMNEVKNNHFEGLEAANRAQGDNKGELVFQGLQYLCNSNSAVTGNTYDFLVFGEGIAVSQGGGIATKNTFSHLNSSFGDFNNQSTNGISYFHSSPYEETPLMTPSETYYFNIEPIEIGLVTDCSGAGGGEIPIPDDDDAMLTPTEEQSLALVYQNALSSHTSLLSSYESSLNGGQSEDVLAAQVAGATSQTASQLEQALLTYSPYLTTGVLEAVVGRTDIYTDASIEAILEANPDELRSPSFQAFLYGELSAVLVDSILTQQHQVTARTNDEATLTSHMMDMHRAANRIIKSVLADTTGIDFAKYRLWLDNKGNLEAAYEKVGSYLLQGDYTTARSVRDSISSAFDLQGDGLTEHTHFANLSEIAITAMENSIPVSGFDTARVAQVQAIADASIGLAGSLAQGLLNFYYGYNYLLLPEQLGGGQQGLAASNHSGQLQAEVLDAQPLVAMPNPARGQVTFRYKLESETPATLRVFDLDGKQVHSTGLEGQQGELAWDTSYLSHGVYYCHIVQAGYSYPALKLVIIK